MDTIGQRIRIFRQKRNISQLDLEVSIAASGGTVSRIEHDRINPTKETILKIAKVLELNHKEVDYLIGFTSDEPTDSEIEKACSVVDEYFSKKGVLAYLLDDRWVFQKISKFFPKILGVSVEESKRIIGKSTVQLFIDGSLPAVRFLDMDHYEEMLMNHIPYYYSQVYFRKNDPSVVATLHDIRKHDLASKIWNSIDHEVIYNPKEERIIHFNIKGFKVPTMYSREGLARYPRFEVVEYTPMNDVIKFLLKMVKSA
ncbi:MAG TPA: helix-turn-helix transcriptional regulator [Candidatus Dojkabacteria bacterium]|jgi:transcriptional regulator with XRE-family HTH domain